MTDELTIVHVAENALIEFIEQVARGRATNISVSKADAGWTVTYKAPFTRDVKGCDEPEKHTLKVACGKTDCEHIAECVKNGNTYCGDKFYVRKLPLELEVSNA